MVTALHQVRVDAADHGRVAVPHQHGDRDRIDATFQGMRAPGMPEGVQGVFGNLLRWRSRCGATRQYSMCVGEHLVLYGHRFIGARSSAGIPLARGMILPLSRLSSAPCHLQNFPALDEPCI